MFNYATIQFPTIKNVDPPNRLSSFILRKERYAHEIAVVTFRDWNIPQEALTTGTPVQCLLRNADTSKEFFGYVHHANPVFTPGTRTTTITIVGATYPLSQASQRIFTNITADQAVKQIVADSKLVAVTEKHPRVWSNISQAGRSDFEMLVWLAKKCGYSLRTDNTTVYFKPQNADYADLRASAPYFIMRQANDPSGSTLYSFEALIGNSTYHLDSMKSVITVSGVNALGANKIQAVKKERPQPLRTSVYSEVFDRYATEIVAPADDIGYYEAEAADARNRYPYRAMVEVVGTPTLRPDMPIFLDGLGPQYSGYWIVLAVDHMIVEESLNNFRYTCLVEIGTDSLGSAAPWTDGQVVPFPTNLSTEASITQNSIDKANAATGLIDV